MSKREFRFAAELRAAGSTAKPMLAGYAAVFNQRANIGNQFAEVIMPGAFKRCLQNNPDVRALIDHDPSKILGRTKAGTLRLSEDAKGLRCEISLPDTALGRDVYTSVQRGDLGEMSFGFTPVDEDFSAIKEAPYLLRTLNDVDVFDVSVVTFPAYEGTSISARAAKMLFPEGRPEYLEARNLQRTLRNHAASDVERSAARARAKSVLDEIAQQEIERQQNQFKASLL